jgi:hypothetical protein
MMEINHYVDPGVDGRIKADLQKVGCRGMDWTELAKDRNRWREFVNRK